MVETVYHCVSLKYLQRLFPAKPGSSLFLEFIAMTNANVKVIKTVTKTASEPYQTCFPRGALGKTPSVVNHGSSQIRRAERNCQCCNTDNLNTHRVIENTG